MSFAIFFGLFTLLLSIVLFMTLDFELINSFYNLITTPVNRVGFRFLTPTPTSNFNILFSLNSLISAGVTWIKDEVENRVFSDRDYLKK